MPSRAYFWHNIIRKNRQFPTYMHKKSYFFQSFLFVALFLGIVNTAISQCEDPITFEVDEIRGVEGEVVCFEIRVNDFEDIGSFLIPFSFDPNILRYVNCTNGDNFPFDCELGNTPDKLASGIVQLFWNFSRAVPNITLADGDVLLNLCFEVIGDVGSCTKVLPGSVPPLGNVPGVIMEIFRGDCSVPTEVISDDVGEFKVSCGSLDIGNTVCPSTTGSNNGSIRFFLCGGEAPYTYELQGQGINGSAEELEEVIIPNLGPGNYTLSVQNRDGVTVALPGGGNFTIEEGAPVEIVNIITEGPACAAANENGFANVMASGGTPPYSYKWSTTEVDINPLNMIGAGDYSVTVSDANGCKAEEQFTIEFNEILLVDVQTTASGCENSADGSVLFDITGGNPQQRANGTFRYRISIDGERDFPYTIPAVPIPNQEPGTHTVRIFDNSAPALSCFIDATYTIDARKDFAIEINGANSGCSAGGTVSVNARQEPDSDPASGDLTFRLLDANGVEVDIISNTADTNFDFTGVSPGSYTVQMIDNADGCSFRSPAAVAVDAPSDGLDIDANIIQPLACGEDAIIEITGLGPDIDDLVFEWNNGTTITGDNTIMVGVEDNYNVTVTDPTGCTGNFDGRLIEIRNESVNLDFNNPNSAFGVDTIVNSLSCFGDPGSIEIDIRDPIVRSMATYTWFEDGTQIIGENSLSLNDLTPGNYSVEISGTNICTVTEDFTINPGMAMEIVVNQQQTVCAGDPVDFTIDFENASGDVNFTIQNIDTGEPLPETRIQNGVPPGTYQIDAEDFQGCPASLSYVVDAFEEIVIPQLNVTNNDCFGLSNGTASFNLAALSGGNGTDKFIVWSTDPDNPTTDIANISDLPNGTYSVLVFDDECTSEEIFFDVTSPEEIKIDDLNSVINQATCFGDTDGGGVLAVSGGSGTADLFRLRDLETAELFPFFTNTITGLPQGSYSVQITDDTGCAGTDTIMVAQPDSLITMIDSAMVVNLSCNADDIGIIRTIQTGGNEGVFTYTWSHDPNLNSPTATNLGEGIFTLTVEDSRGCTDITEFEMMSPEMISLSNFDTLLFVQCFGDRLQFGGLEPSGGTNSGFRYSINNGNLMPISDSIFLSAGRYDLEIRDQDGCPLDTVFVISEPNEVVVELGPDVEINLGDSHQLRAEHDPAEQIVLYEWDPLEPDESPEGQVYEVTPLDDTVYGVRIENSAGCSDEDEVMVRVRRDRNVYIPNIINTGRNDANASFSIFAGQGVERIEFFQIFDRWGNKVHEVKQVNGNPLGSAVWDARLNGTLVEPGVYVYIARVLFTDGEELDYKGDVTVVR